MPALHDSCKRSIKLGSNPIKVVFQNAEAIAIVAGVALYFKEIPDRKAQKHYKAWQVIDNAKGVYRSPARRKALEDLYSDRVSLANIAMQNVDLSNQLLNGVDLSNAYFESCDLTGVDFTGADLSKGHFRTQTILTNTNFTNADLRDAYFGGVIFNKDGSFSPQQIKSARNWETATYDSNIRVLLGLDP